MKFIGLDGREYNKSITASDYVRTPESRSRGEQWLYDGISCLFPYYDILEEFQCIGLSRLRIDFLILSPGIRIAFEYDGEQHHKYVPHFHRSRKGHADSIIRDSQKDQWCKINAIKLIRINKQDDKLLKRLINE